MQLNGLHFLLTYKCILECRHCFVWGSPWQEGVMSLHDIRRFLEQARQTGTIDWVYFEGGEPFLFYALLQQAVGLAAEMGFKVGIVSNAFWATTPEDAELCLQPFAGRLQNLTISSDMAGSRSCITRNHLSFFNYCLFH